VRAVKHRLFSKVWLAVPSALSFSPLLWASVEAEAGHDAQAPLVGFQLPTFVWTVGTFLVVLFILKKKAWGPMLQALDERERKIKESLEAAERATAESARVAGEHQRVLAEARKEASAIVDEGKRDAEAVRDAIVAEAREGAESIKGRALSDIERAKDHAVHEIHQRAVELSIAISEKLIAKSLSADEHKGLIDETIESYGKLN